MDLTFNWIWQGAALTAGTAMSLRFVRSTSAATRHAIWWITLAAVMALPSAAALWPVAQSLREAASTAPLVGPSGAPLIDVAVMPRWLAAGLAASWLAGTVLLLARLGRSLVHVWRVKATATPLPPDRLRRLRSWTPLASRGRRVAVASSPAVRSAGAFGFGRGVIVLPAGLADELDDTRLDQILIHEVAHLRRRDDLGCLVQAVARALAWWHPAVWWIDRELTLEREAACDDWVVRHSIAARDYAACLTELAARLSHHAPLAVPGMLARASHLTTRVLRLLDARRNRNLRQSRAAVTAAIAALAVASVWLAALGPRVAGNAEALASGVVRVDLPSMELPATAADAPASAEQASRDRAEDAGTPPQSREEAITTDGPVPGIVPAAPRSNGPPAGGIPASSAPAVRETSGPADSPPAPLDATNVPHAATLVAAPVPATLASRGSDRQADAVTVDTPWSDAATAGSAIGHASRRAATATAGFFTRTGRSIAGAF
jgi:beta-lactamase regulating signal transducer with metallopeptidase domain